MRGTDPDRLLLRRARRALALQNMAAVAVIVLIAGLIVAYGVAWGQRSDLERSLRQTAATEEDVVDPPPGSWIFTLDPAGRLSSTGGAPTGFPDRAALGRVRAGGAAETTAVDVAGTDYLVVTQARGAETVQVVGSLAAQERERHRLLTALGVAAAVGLAAAAASGILLARRATAPLGQALARQRRFVADASHELRTPVTQLHTRAQLLHQDLRAGSSPAEMAADVEQLLTGTRQLGEVIDDLLLSTQLENSAGAAEEVDLGVVAAGAVTAFTARAQELGVSLVLTTDAEAPSLVTGREAALRRVVTALLDNALSHTAAGGRVSVDLRSRLEDHLVILTVRDDGTGFEPGDADRIFDRFARGHADQRRFGLGLALAREVVAGHGGTIEAGAEPGHGAVFTVRLPALRP
ncbi:sensor histidine kinase [Paractinoplanes atraurantiacus]|uniref:Sensor-like histidine kinase SenX3 n=1 Tax=Paractinoplanes atraurantiacus TaxID=1036182 RepID=A0A285JJ97_9ACTN|nr:HAMP domain-containing sensor histidine kinase [Actinoplanes atraurantiacus]SNY59446.1 His Kinase A (phospho-acceptor) domain-containing protein [Actinoplanes atraurantiacus]